MGPFADNGTVKKIIQEWGIWDKKTEKKTVSFCSHLKVEFKNSIDLSKKPFACTSFSVEIVKC